MLDHWNHLPHWVRAIVLGNIIQGIFVGVMRWLRVRHGWLGPILDRVGPKALRSKTRARVGEGFVIGVIWFALSWYVGHSAMKFRAGIVRWLN